ncbi:MAG: TonB-dependent receptor [Acidobacteriota bacterium]|nr:TonB-dependent receptor [Acidobacteriota bacterium]MDH3522808.1 TonB-dependent receptor [Acidobacteriota bacterium]
MRNTRLVAVLGGALLCAQIASGQTLDAGQVRGVVTDETGGSIPGATVTLQNPETGFSRSAETNESGTYRLIQIPAGRYSMQVELSGFSSEVADIEVNVGASLTFDFTLTLEMATETITVQASAAPIDVASAGVSQLISEQAIENLPLLGRDFRDLALLSPAAQVTPGLRGGLRLGGQQSDYSGLSIDGADGRDNFFGEFFGSLETKNSVIPIEAVQEFQVVTNGFAPEFGRSTGGLLNVVTKSGTNQLQGSAHWYHRNDSLTEDDWLGTPPNIDSQNQIGAALGGPIKRDKHYYFVAFDVSERTGPLVTKFSRDVSGVSAPELGISDLASLEGANEQSQDLLSILAKWDSLPNPSNRFSVRSFYTENKTNGFTGGRGQNQIQASFGNTERFENSGTNTIFTWNKVSKSGRGANELKVMYSDQIRPREPNSNLPEINILDTGTFGQRFFLPIQGDNEKITFQENYQVAFGDHDVKFGADINQYSIRNNRFFGWSAGSYSFFTLEDFQAGTPFGFIQGFGLGEPYAEAAIRTERVYQTGYGLYVQDKWQVKPNLTVNYGLRWDGTDNPTARSPIAGESVPLGVGSGTRFGTPPQDPPDDFDQFGPRLGAAYSFDMGGRPAVLRGSWGLYYAQTPTIFLGTGSGNTAVTFCFFNPACIPPGGYPNLWPDAIDPDDPLVPQGPFDTTYDDPSLRNPRVMNTTVALEVALNDKYTVTTTVARAESDYLRTGGFSSTQWNRNFESLGTDEFGRTILGGPVDDTVAGALANGSFSRGLYQQAVVNLTRRFADGFQWFVNYSWSSNKDNASSERDTDTYFGPQDPYNIDIDYGRSALDIPHQLKISGTKELGRGFLVSGLFIARSGVPYPACSIDDTNGDGVNNNGCNNDRPVVNGQYLLQRYPARQPDFYQLDVRVSKNFSLGDRRHIEVIADIFNILDVANKYSNPAISSLVASELDGNPQPGDIGPTGVPYRTLDQVSPGSTPRAIQLGVRFTY